MFLGREDKLPELEDQQPLYVEPTVLRQLPHILHYSVTADGDIPIDRRCPGTAARTALAVQAQL